MIREFEDTPLAEEAQGRIAQLGGLPPVPPQQMQWLVNLFPESDDVKSLLGATEEARLAKADESSRERNAEMEERQASGQHANEVGQAVGNFLDR